MAKVLAYNSSGVCQNNPLGSWCKVEHVHPLKCFNNSVTFQYSHLALPLLQSLDPAGDGGRRGGVAPQPSYTPLIMVSDIKLMLLTC